LFVDREDFSFAEHSYLEVVREFCLKGFMVDVAVLPRPFLKAIAEHLWSKKETKAERKRRRKARKRKFPNSLIKTKPA
jgi:hypothetical protein